MIRRAGYAALRGGLQRRVFAAPTLRRFAADGGGAALVENRMNEPGPIFKRPDRPIKSSPRLRLVGNTGPVQNMDMKTSIDELSPAFCRHRTEIPFGFVYPSVSPEGFVAPNVTLVGDVELGDRCFVWSGAVIRGDENEVVIGAMTNVFENTIITADCQNTDISIDTDGTGGRVAGFPGKVKIGTFVTIGPNCVLRACTIEHSVVIGAGSVICEGAYIEAGAIVGPGSIVPPGRRVPANQRWEGRPVQFVEESEDFVEANDDIAKKNYERVTEYVPACYPLHTPDYSMLHKLAATAIAEGR